MQFNVVVYNPLMISTPMTLWIPQEYELSSNPPAVQDNAWTHITAQVREILQTQICDL